MLKDLTIKQTTWMIAMVSFIIHCLFLSLLVNLGYINILLSSNWVVLIIIILISFVLSFIAIRYLIELFVNRKIKLIYTIISDSKLGIKEKKPVLNPDSSLEDVNKEVIEWAEKASEELSSLRTLEEYRKKYVGFISHELKTPIFTIQGYVHTLLEGGIYDEKINIKYLKRAAKNIERIQNIVDDLEQINKLESEKIRLEKSNFDIRTLVEEVYEDVEAQATAKGIQLFFEQPSDKSFGVNGDREAIRQVLSNLITNSVKYGKDYGETIVSFYDLENKILIEISDNGIGIAESHFKHLFDRFYRVEHSRSREQGGSGLGLSIVKHILEAHQQTINIRSTPGVGSTFGFSLDKA